MAALKALLGQNPLPTHHVQRFSMKALRDVRAQIPPEQSGTRKLLDFWEANSKPISLGHDVHVIEVEYSAKVFPWGRLVSASPSYQGMWKPVKFRLCQGLYLDVDIRNAHPVCLLRELEKHGIACPALKAYVTNREPSIQAVIQSLEPGAVTRDQTKTAFLRPINFGNYQSPDEETKFVFPSNLTLDHYQAAVQRAIMSLTTASPLHRQLYAVAGKLAAHRKQAQRRASKNAVHAASKAKRRPKSTSQRGIYASWVCCMLEARALASMMEILPATAVQQYPAKLDSAMCDVGANAYDGFLEGGLNGLQEAELSMVLSQANAAVRQAMDNPYLEFAVKAMDPTVSLASRSGKDKYNSLTDRGESYFKVNQLRLSDAKEVDFCAAANAAYDMDDGACAVTQGRPFDMYIRSVWGSGKSWWSRDLQVRLQHIRQLSGKQLKVLLVSSRRSLSAQQQQEIAAAGIEIHSYQKIVGGLNVENTPISIWQVESLARAFSDEHNAATFDLVVIDEFAALLSHVFQTRDQEEISSAAVVECTPALQGFQALCGHLGPEFVKHLIVMDNDLSQAHVDMFCTTVRKDVPFRVIANVAAPWAQQLNAQIFTGDEADAHVLSLIMQELETQVSNLEAKRSWKGIALIFHSVKMCSAVIQAIKTRFGSRLPDKYFGIYTGETATSKKDLDLANVMVSWLDYLVVAYTTTISVGIDFSSPHIEKAFAFFHCWNALVSDSMQMAPRCRRLTEMAVAYSGRKQSFIPKTEDDILLWVQQAARHVLPGGWRDDLVPELRPQLRPTHSLPDLRGLIESTAHGKGWLVYAVQFCRSRRDFLTEFVRGLHACGIPYAIQDASELESEGLDAERKALLIAKADTRRQRALAIAANVRQASMSDISRGLLNGQRLRSVKTITDEEQAGVAGLQLMRDFRVSVSTVEDSDFVFYFSKHAKAYQRVLQFLGNSHLRPRAIEAAPTIGSDAEKWKVACDVFIMLTKVCFATWDGEDIFLQCKSSAIVTAWQRPPLKAWMSGSSTILLLDLQIGARKKLSSFFSAGAMQRLFHSNRGAMYSLTGAKSNQLIERLGQDEFPAKQLLQLLGPALDFMGVTSVSVGPAKKAPTGYRLLRAWNHLPKKAPRRLRKALPDPTISVRIPVDARGCFSLTHLVI